MLSEEQIRLLERHSCDFRMRHVEVDAPGELLQSGHLLLGNAQGRRQDLRAGRRRCLLLAGLRQGLHLEDARHRRRAALRPRAALLRSPRRRGQGRTDRQRPRVLRTARRAILYELMLAMHDIEHRTTKVRSPRTNGFVERMNRTLLDECFRIKGRSHMVQRRPRRFSGTLTSTSRTTTSSAVTRAIASRAARRLRRCATLSEERNYRPSFQWSKKRPKNRPPDHATETPSVG